MKCSEVNKILKNDSDAEIAANLGLISHVRSCGDCAEKYGLILKLSLATAMKDEVRLPADFEDKVWKKIGEPNPAFSFLRNILQPKLALAAAAAVVVLLVAVPLINKGSGKNSANEIASKQVPKIAAEIKQGAAPDALKKTAAFHQNVVAEKIVEKQVPPKQEPAPAPEQAGQGSLVFTAHHSAPVTAYKTTANTEADNNNIASAAVKKELTASYNKGEDDLKGDVAVSGNVFHPLRGEAVTIKYRVKNASKVIAVVYDRKGKLIKMIYNGDRGPGIYAESWNGTGDNGVVSGGGIYIIYLKTDSAENKIKVGIIK